MSTNMNKVKNHPGFMPFGCSNVKIDGNTVAKEEARRDSQDMAKDKQKA